MWFKPAINLAVSLCSTILALILFLPLPIAIMSSEKQFQILRVYLHELNKSHKLESEFWCWLPNSDCYFLYRWQIWPHVEIQLGICSVMMCKGSYDNDHLHKALTWYGEYRSTSLVLSAKRTSEAKLKSEEVVTGAPFGLPFVYLSI